MGIKWKEIKDMNYGIANELKKMLYPLIGAQVFLLLLTIIEASRDSLIYGTSVLPSIMVITEMVLFYLAGNLLYSCLKYEKVENKIYELSRNGAEITLSPEDGELAVDLLNIQQKLKESMEAKLKSEKLKMELITNVSHDLKTPLTSIISYIDLLKKKGLASDEVAGYVKIISEKALRLKNIIQDVFEMSKASCGDDVLLKQLDLNKLISQTIADMEDRIETSGRCLKTSLYDGTIYFQGDSDKMYRVVQNLIDNALKYSMEGTRIYATVSAIDNEAVFEMKNVAAYEMDFKSDEIIERFARGDKSRSSEGNGLGLAIVKIFTESIGGKFFVTIDGDVFKVGFRVGCKVHQSLESSRAIQEPSLNAETDN